MFQRLVNFFTTCSYYKQRVSIVCLSRNESRGKFSVNTIGKVWSVSSNFELIVFMYFRLICRLSRINLPIGYIVILPLLRFALWLTFLCSDWTQNWISNNCIFNLLTFLHYYFVLYVFTLLTILIVFKF